MVALLGTTGLLLLAAGLAANTWGLIAGGVVTLSAAAWKATEGP